MGACSSGSRSQWGNERYGIGRNRRVHWPRITLGVPGLNPFPASGKVKPTVHDTSLKNNEVSFPFHHNWISGFSMGASSCLFRIGWPLGLKGAVPQLPEAISDIYVLVQPADIHVSPRVICNW